MTIEWKPKCTICDDSGITFHVMTNLETGPLPPLPYLIRLSWPPVRLYVCSCMRPAPKVKRAFPWTLADTVAVIIALFILLLVLSAILVRATIVGN